MLSNPSEGLGDNAAERSVESDLQARRAELALGISRFIARGSAALSITLVVLWLLNPLYVQVLIYAFLMLLLALGAGLYPVFQRRNRATAGLLFVNLLALMVVLLSPMLIDSLMPVIGITDVIAIVIVYLLLGDRRSRWWVGAYALAYGIDVVVVTILEWSPFPPLERSAELWITGIVSLVGFLTAILIIRRIILGQEQQFRLTQRLNLELENQVRMVVDVQETLKQERNLLRLLIDTIPANVYIKDTESRFVEANLETALQMGARSPNDLIGKTDFDFFNAVLAGKYFADEQAVLRSGVALRNSEESNFDQRTQQTSWFLTTKVPILDPQGVVTGLVGVGLDITERKQVQEQIAQERAVLRTLIDHIPDYIYIKDSKGRFVNSNAAHNKAAQVTDADELRGKSAFEVFPPDLAAQFEADDQTILQTGQALVNVERTSMDEQGKERTMLTTKVPLRDPFGKVTGLVGISHDITALKQAETALQEERTLLRTLIDAMPDYIYIKDRQSRFVIGNIATALSLGAASPDDIVGKTDFDFHPPDRAARFFADEQALLSSGEPLLNHEEVVIDQRTGEQQILLSTNVPLYDSRGRITGLVGANRDITARKQAEAALLENEAKLQTFFKVLPVGVSVLNSKGQMVEMNPALERILDISLDGQLSRVYRPRGYIFADGRPMLSTELPSERARIEQQAFHDIEVGVIKEDGTTLWTSISAAPLPGVNSGVITVIIDITERKRAEVQAFALAAEQQRGTLLREFITDVSHDFRTPLTIIGTSAFLLGKTTDPGKLTQYSQRIEDQISRLGLLLDSFVELAHLEQQASALPFQATGLDELVRTVVERSQPEVTSKHQSLVYQCETSSAQVLGDPTALSKAITNVVTNAIHYTPQEGIIALRLYRDGDNAVLEIADTGIGIAASDLPRIFDSFYRVDSARSTQSGGAGLGLSIAKKIVALMHGHIEVESEVGKGSVFRIYLPVSQ